MSTRTYREAWLAASFLLEEAGQHVQIAEWLLLHVLQCTRGQWLANMNELMPLEEEQQYQELIEQVLAGQPYQYLIGLQEFYGRQFKVSPAVLIPRPETELLVEYVLQEIKELWPEARPLTAVDVGTGSGVIALTLALEAAHLQVTAVDISTSAAAIAQENAEKYAVSCQIVVGDILEPLLEAKQAVDIIVSNPPYIGREEIAKIDQQVLDYEPHLALFAEEQGLYFYQQICQQSTAILKQPGLLAFEVGMGQAQEVVDIIKAYYPQASCQVKEDLRGVERVVLAVVSP